MIRLDDVHFKKFSNIPPGTKLNFSPKGAVLIGKNGTGKTTLLNTIVAICKCDFDEVSSSDFDITFTVTQITSQPSSPDTKRVTHISVTMQRFTGKQTAANETSSAAASLLSALTNQSTNLNIRCNTEKGVSEFESNQLHTKCKYPNGDEKILNVTAQHGWLAFLNAALNAPQEHKDALTNAAIELQFTNNTLRRFDEGLGYFNLLTTKAPEGFSLIAHVREDKTLDTALSVFSSQLVNPPVAQHLTTNYDGKDEKLKGLYASSETTEFLRTFCQLTKFEHVSVLADIEEEKKVDDIETVTFRPLWFFCSISDGIKIHHDRLSFGQKRLLSFLFYHQNNNSIVAADELVNGLHHDWVASCVEKLSSRQAFLSSQNPLLFDCMGFESKEDAASQFIECGTDSEHRFTWQNMKLADAGEFYETYLTGIQHISEILRTRGYW